MHVGSLESYFKTLPSCTSVLEMSDSDESIFSQTSGMITPSAFFDRENENNSKVLMNVHSLR